MDIAIKDVFNFNRFFNMCKIEFFTSWKMFLLKDMIIALIYINFSFFGFMFHSYNNNPNFILFISLFISNILISISFKEIHNNDNATSYFMFPASIEEKYIIKFMFTMIIYFISTIVTIFLASLISETIKVLIFKGTFNVFNPISFDMLNIFLIYLYFHSINFFGAVFFKKWHYLKTALSLIIIWTILFIASSIIVLLFFSKLNLNNQVINLFDVLSKNNTTSLITKISSAIIPIALYVLTFIRLKRSEVK